MELDVSNRRWVIALLLTVGLVTAVAASTREHWSWVFASSASEASGTAHDDHDDQLSVKGLVLSDAARESLGLKLGPIVLKEYWRSLPMPGEVIEEPGHCEQGVTSAVHGIVLKIYAFHGQTVRSGDPLFDLRLTSELLATAQSSLLKSIQEIEFVQAELDRLAPRGEPNQGIPVARVIEKQNELKRLNALRLLQMQELMVRGLTADQIADMIRTRTLIQQITVRVPLGQSNDDTDVRRSGAVPEPASGLTPEKEDVSQLVNHHHGSVYSVEQLNVHLGKLVEPGTELCHLARHAQLQITGRAFERENFLVTRAIEQNWPVKVVFESTEAAPIVREGLKILYSDNVVEPDSRTIRFYLPLPNEIVRDQTAANGLPYRSWRFKPGQRVRLFLPVEHLLNQIVVPSESLVKEGFESFVFRANGKRLEQVPVRVLHQDSQDAVLKNGGGLMAGDVIAMNQAFQLELALKNSQGGRAAGHNGHGHDHAGHDHAGHEH